MAALHKDGEPGTGSVGCSVVSVCGPLVGNVRTASTASAASSARPASEPGGAQPRCSWPDCPKLQLLWWCMAERGDEGHQLDGQLP